MKEFLAQHMELLLAAVGLCIFVIAVVRMLKKAKKIDREGLVADAVVSRVERIWDESDGTSYITYVKYMDRDGVERESKMSLTPQIEYSTGDEVRIKYLPGKYKMVREAK